MYLYITEDETKSDGNGAPRDKPVKTAQTSAPESGNRDLKIIHTVCVWQLLSRNQMSLGSAVAE